MAIGDTSTMHGRLALAAAAAPGAPAIHEGDVTTSYAELAARVAAVAAVVERRTAPGDRVAIAAWNGSWWLDAYFGVPMAGRALAMVSPRLSVGELRQALDTCSASLVVVDAELVGGHPEALGAPGRTVISLADWRRDVAAAVGTSPARVTDDGDSPAWLVYTSGTTGAPKAAVLTHRNVLAAIAATEGARPTPADDVYLYPFPMWHVAGYNVVSRLIAGQQVVVVPRFDASAIVVAVARHGATSISVAATMLSMLLDIAERDPAALAALRGLRQVNYGAAPMPSVLLARAVDLLDVGMWQGYGMTELAGNAAFLSADDHRRARAGDESLHGATGRAGPGVELRVVDDDGNDVAPGASGEILVRGDQVMSGYWDDPEATAEAFAPGGWLRTGDVGTLDADGLLRVRDRKKDVVITGGENVSAREVEEVLRDHPAVADVAVVGVADPTWGEAVCAVVVPRGAAPTLDELRTFARSRLAGFKLPRRLELCDALPTNPSGKVVKAELRARLAEGS